MKQLINSITIIKHVALLVFFVTMSIAAQGQGLRIYKTDGTTQLIPYASFDSIVGYDIPVLSIESDDTIKVSKDGLKDMFKIRSNMAWTLNNIPSWISITPTSGFGNSIVNITVKSNSGEPRTAELVFECEDKTTYTVLVIFQEKIEFEYVDLGLSVKWATFNVGATKPEEYGDYFAWGETETKDSYSPKTYKWCNDRLTSLTKYNDYGPFFGTVDNRTVIELSDDIARQKWGGSWRMPTITECQELIDNCTWSWTTMNGVNGYKVTSKKSGYSNRFIFLPAAGYRDESSLYDAGEYGGYWSSSLYTNYPTKAWRVYIDSDGHCTSISSRDYGQSVRPVCP